MGGLARRESYWNGLLSASSAGTEPPLLVDLGNNFPVPSPQGRLKIDVIQAYFARMPADAILPGPAELQVGHLALDHRLPYLLTNNEIAGTFAPVRTVKRARGEIVLLGYLSPTLVYQGLHEDSYRLAKANAALLKRMRGLIRSAAAQHAVLLFRGDDAELARFARSGLFSTIIVGNPSADETNNKTSRKIGGRSYPQVATKGQAATQLALGKRVSAQVEWLTEKYADAPLAMSALKIYDAKVKQLFESETAARQTAAQHSPFVGADACKQCHVTSFSTWQASPHAQALSSLSKVGKQFDPECLECHVVGLNARGFVSAEATPDLAGVQCESCHGAAKAHAANPARARLVGSAGPSAAPPAEGVCRTCHRGAHSPKFEFARYWPRIAHGN